VPFAAKESLTGAAHARGRYISKSQIVRNRDFEEILDVLLVACQQAGPSRVSVGDVMTIIGDRSFGPLLLVPGLIGLSPIGAIPGVPGVMAVIVMIVASQILVGMDHAWLPSGLTRRSIEAPTPPRR
jgi:hypothetical protein